MPGNRNKNTKRFRELVFPHLKFLYNVAYRYAGNRQDAEDMVQETAYTALKNLHQLREEKGCKSWLFTILKNLHFRELRHKARCTVPPFNDNDTDYPDQLQEVAQLRNAEEALAKRIDSLRIQQVLNDLPEKYKSPLILYYVEGMSYREISEVADIPLGTVMSRLSRGKELLKKGLLTSVHGAAGKRTVVRLKRAGEA